MKKIIVRRKIQEGEGVWDSISAFGRQAADTATFGGYKYARAGVDYAAKNAMKLAGYGKGTTYDKELEQEKEKLAHDEKEHSQASSAGKLTGMGSMAVAPEIPVVGAALSGAMKAGETASRIPSYYSLAKKAIGLQENLAGAGTSGDGGMSAPFSATGQEIDARRKQKPIPLGKTMGSYVDEDASANAAGGGNVAGLGVGPQGEPGRPPQLMPMARRGKPFMGIEPYVVSSKVFNQLREAKRRGKHWRTYLEEDDAYHHIRMEAKKSKGPIVVEDERTGALMYVRYGKGGSLQEAWSNEITRSNKLGGAVGRTERDHSEALYHFGGTNHTYRGHSVHQRTFKNYSGGEDSRLYTVRHPESGKVVAQVMLHKISNKSGSGHKVAAAAAEGVPGGMHGFYHHLLKRGHVKSLVGDDQSEGAQKVWTKLSKKPGTTVHGWSKGKPVNLGKSLSDPEETHAPKNATEPEEKAIGNMKLVASYNAPKKKIIVRKRK